MVGFVIDTKVRKTPNALESGGKRDILSSTLILQVSLEEFKRSYKF